jgi:hypothetical protein
MGLLMDLWEETSIRLERVPRNNPHKVILPPEAKVKEPGDFLWYCIFCVISKPHLSIVWTPLHDGRGMRLRVESAQEDYTSSQLNPHIVGATALSDVTRVMGDIFAILNIGQHLLDGWRYDIGLVRHTLTYYTLEINVYPANNTFMYVFCRNCAVNRPLHENPKGNGMIPSAAWETHYLLYERGLKI